MISPCPEFWIQLPGFRTISIGFVLAVLLSPTIVPLVARMVYGRALTKTALLVVIAAPFVTVATLSMDHSRSFSEPAWINRPENSETEAHK
jgi:hypothetical protein